MRNYDVSNNTPRRLNLVVIAGIAVTAIVVLICLVSALLPSTNLFRNSTSLTLSEMLNSRIESDGYVAIYELKYAVDSPADISKDNSIKTWIYDGNTLKYDKVETSLGDIARGAEVSDLIPGYAVKLGITTDKSGNTPIHEELYNEYNEVLLRFGMSETNGEVARVTIYDKTYLCFMSFDYVQPIYGYGETDKGNIAGRYVVLVEDKDDTKNKSITLDAIGTAGITIDATGSRDKTINDIADEPLFGN